MPDLSRLLLWVTTAALGVAALFMTSLVGPFTFLVLAVAVVVIARADRFVALSGLMIGYGGLWLVLLSRPSAPGAGPERSAWAFGIVTLAIGLAALVPTIVRTLRRG